MIPPELTERHIQSAIDLIDGDGVPAHRRSVHYHLKIEGKRYPPKYVISLATRFATGEEHPPEAFNAVEAKNYFQTRGYEVVDDRGDVSMRIALEDEESAFPEGAEVYRSHRSYERDTALANKAKDNRLRETGKLACDVCGFDFHRYYGERGSGFIEAHHTVPVSELGGHVHTKMSDLALVCSNCHRMLHRGPHLMTVDQLRDLFKGGPHT